MPQMQQSNRHVDLNYFVCTLGQAADINNGIAHPFESINDFIDHQAQKFPDHPAFGFPVPRSHSDHQWDQVSYNLATEAINKSLATGHKINRETLVEVEGLRDAMGTMAQSWMSEDIPNVCRWESKETDVAYLHHTSGTSTGLPKPIPQTHRAAVGVLPTLTNGRDRATFTTTPLYHGGIADCFRAWTSRAMIWLFPGAGVPITASNVLKCLECTRRSTEISQTPKVTYFSSVPYVLQMVAAENEGMRILKNMEVVGVGGAALPQTVGDELVKEGVNLITRFGSAECGFLMSSHRHYVEDKEWQYLRSNASPHLTFEAQGDGLAELVILPTWPHMAKKNRKDGSYATADLFAPHQRMQNAWRYHSRADSQLTLVTGKKFDPAPLEAAITASSLVSDVLVFGNGRQYPGALIFRSATSSEMTKEGLLRALWPAIEELNVESQNHSRLSKSMLVVMPKDASGLEKSSKGTILRAQADKKYAQAISQAYEDASELDPNEQPNAAQNNMVSDEEVPTTVLRIIKSVTDAKDAIPAEADLFSLGVDSVASMQIRSLLQSKLLPPDAASLPLNVIYDCGTIKNLSKHLVRIRKGQTVDKEDETQLMHDLVKEYSRFNAHSGSSDRVKSAGLETVILTGATGALGAHILRLLQASGHVFQIHCLVRAASQAAANERVSKSLIARNIFSLSTPDSPGCSKVHCHPCKLSSATLGLPESLYEKLASEATLVIHAAWAVNFSMRLSSFVKDHIAGLQNLINFALSSPHKTPPRIMFCSSTASVLGPNRQSLVPDSISHDPLTASPLGYSRSKWVAESICEQAHLKTSLRNNIWVLRIGQLCGDTNNGVWSTTEAWPLMLSSLKVTHSLPNLKGEALGWLPVDIAAKAALEMAFALATEKPEMPVYHILNPNTQTTWSDLLRWLQKLSPGFEVISPAEWVLRLENLTGEKARHPARKLLGLWKEAYCSQNATDSPNQEQTGFEMRKTADLSHVMRNIRPIDEKQVQKMWRWMEKEMGG